MKFLYLIVFFLAGCASLPQTKGIQLSSNKIKEIIKQIGYQHMSCHPNIAILTSCNAKYGVPESYQCILAFEKGDTYLQSKNFFYSVGIKDSEIRVFNKLSTEIIDGQSQVLTITSGCPY